MRGKGAEGSGGPQPGTLEENAAPPDPAASRLESRAPAGPAFCSAGAPRPAAEPPGYLSLVPLFLQVLTMCFGPGPQGTEGWGEASTQGCVKDPHGGLCGPTPRGRAQPSGPRRKGPQQMWPQGFPSSPRPPTPFPVTCNMCLLTPLPQSSQTPSLLGSLL